MKAPLSMIQSPTANADLRRRSRFTEINAASTCLASDGWWSPTKNLI